MASTSAHVYHVGREMETIRASHIPFGIASIGVMAFAFCRWMIYHVDPRYPQIEIPDATFPATFHARLFGHVFTGR